MFKKFIAPIVGIALLGAAGSAHAAAIVVDAKANDWGATGAATGMSLNIGDTLVVSVPTNDCWSAGAFPRDSNADGLMVIDNNTCQVGNSGFGDYSTAGLAAPFGSLVGTIGGNTPFFIGTSYNQAVTDSGALLLWYWDSNGADNTGFITASVRVIQQAPEPAMIGFLGLGFLGLGLTRKRRKQTA
jgi:PEP-CTERM motif-containing protein